MSETLLQGRHSMDSAEWYSTPEIVELARELMGEIYLDPCSCFEANQIVKAKKYYTAVEDGLALEWSGRVFVNPPGGAVNNFWRKMLTEFAFGRFNEAVWVGYSLEQLQTMQITTSKSPMDFPICVPRRRIAFIESAEKQAERRAKCEAAGKPFREKSSPSHGNYLTYLGPQVERFREIFGRIGVVR